MDQMKKSLLNELKEYGESDFYPFHMPGHKRNLASGYLADFYQLDITEIDGFDNLHEAQGILKEAQERAACLYRSEETFFLINGSTAGILAAISASAKRGRKLIVARNCHKSVFHAAFLNHLEVEYIYPGLIEEFGILDGISAAQVEEKLQETGCSCASIAGIVLTSPTYDGILSDVRGIAELAHRHGIPVIIDQAHGAHFGFHPFFPESAVLEGADIVIHSVHKTLPAPTQTALLHVDGSLVNRELLRKYLRIYQSSSPSYLLMAGIDSCMEMMEKEGKERFGKLLSYRKEFVRKAEKLKYIKIYPSMAERGKKGQDISQKFEKGMEEPGKLLISVRGTDFTGRQLYDMLRESYHLQMEMCAFDYVTAILSIMDTEDGFKRLLKALEEIDKMLCQSTNVKTRKTEARQEIAAPCGSLEEDISLLCQKYRPEAVFPIYEAFAAENRLVPLEEAEGEAAADFINLYPPGIPILAPGERIDDKALAIIKGYLAKDFTVQGVETPLQGFPGVNVSEWRENEKDKNYLYIRTCMRK